MRFAAWVLLLAVFGLGIASCASTPPSSFYTLSPLPDDGSDAALRGGDISIGLGPVAFPAFLDRPQLVTRETNNRLGVDEFNRWGGTLQDDFLRVWSENLSRLLGTSRILVLPSELRYPLDFRIVADILAFEGTADGQALLKVRWTVLDPTLEQVLTIQETSYRHPVGSPNDDNALIAALSAALGDFSRDVAQALRKLPRQPAVQQIPER